MNCLPTPAASGTDPANDFERALVDDSPAPGAHIQIIPAAPNARHHLVAVWVTRKKPMVYRPVTADANPRFWVSGFARNVLLGHVGVD